MAVLVDRVRNPNRTRRFIAWLKGVPGSIFEMKRPLTHIIEGGPILRGVVALVVLVFIVGVSWLGGDWFAQNRPQRITLFGAIASIFLTYGLIWVYLSIAESERTQAQFVEKQTELQDEIQLLQEKQVELQKSQVEIMGAEFEPVIEILDFGRGDEKPPTDYLLLGDDPPHGSDYFKIKISNLSDAIATNLRLRFLVDYIGPWNLVTGVDVPLMRVGSDQSWTSKPGGIIRGQRTEVEYHCIAGMKLPPKARENILPFTTCMRYLCDNADVSRIRIGLLLVYEDRKGTEHEIKLEGLELQEAERPDADPTLARVRNASSYVPIPVIKEEFLRQGISEIPPQYTR